jgi:hypothetical protein
MYIHISRHAHVLLPCMHLMPLGAAPIAIAHPRPVWPVCLCVVGLVRPFVKHNQAGKPRRPTASAASTASDGPASAASAAGQMKGRERGRQGRDHHTTAGAEIGPGSRLDTFRGDCSVPCMLGD